MIKMMRVVLILLVSASFAGCGKQETKTIRAAYVPAGFYAPILLAESRGYFKDEGYEIQLARYNNNALMINAFINGAVDLTAQSALTMLPVEEENPGTFKFIYGQLANSYFFVVPAASDINSIEDLSGKVIGTWQSPTAVAYIDLVLADNKVSKSDVNIQRFAVSDVAASLENNNVDAVFTFDFQAAFLEQSGKFRILAPDSLKELLEGESAPFNGGGLVNTKLIQEDPQKIAAIEHAISRALDDIKNHPVEARVELAEILKISIDNPGAVRLDQFSLPDDSMVLSAEKTYELLVSQKIASGSANVAGLFMRDQ